MEHLSGLDATFLYIETPSNQLQMTGVLVFDPSTMDSGYSFDKMREFVRSRLTGNQAFTRKLVEVPFRVAHPVWVEDPNFNLDAHIHRVALPSPGGERELADLTGEVMGIPLDHGRPLWEMWFVEGLEHGHAALIAKMHHATIDGVSGANLMMHLFDLEPDPQAVPAPPPALQPARTPTPLELLADGLWSRARLSLLLPRAASETARATFEIVRRRVKPSSGTMATPFTAPPTPFNTSISSHRTVAFRSVPLQELRAVKDAFGTTLNDAILAVCAGAVRRWLQARNALPRQPLIAAVPVSTRSREESGTFGNLVSAMFVSLATDIDDPVARLLSIQQATKGAKEEFSAVGADTLRNWTEFSGPRLLGLAIRLYSRMQLAEHHLTPVNFLVSNVPGPPTPLYFAGGRLVKLYPLGPVFDGMGLNITVLSYLDSVGFGFVACPELIPDLWDVADGAVDALGELKTKATQVGPGQTASPREHGFGLSGPGPAPSRRGHHQ